MKKKLMVYSGCIVIFCLSFKVSMMIPSNILNKYSCICIVWCFLVVIGEQRKELLLSDFEWILIVGFWCILSYFIF